MKLAYINKILTLLVLLIGIGFEVNVYAANCAGTITTSISPCSLSTISANISSNGSILSLHTAIKMSDFGLGRITIVGSHTYYALRGAAASIDLSAGSSWDFLT